MTVHFEDFNKAAAEVRLERMQLERLGVTSHELGSISEMVRNAARIEDQLGGAGSPMHGALLRAIPHLQKACRLAASREEAVRGG